MEMANFCTSTVTRGFNTLVSIIQSVILSGDTTPLPSPPESESHSDLYRPRWYIGDPARKFCRRYARSDRTSRGNLRLGSVRLRRANGIGAAVDVDGFMAGIVRESYATDTGREADAFGVGQFEH